MTKTAQTLPLLLLLSPLLLPTLLLPTLLLLPLSIPTTVIVAIPIDKNILTRIILIKMNCEPQFRISVAALPKSEIAVVLELFEE